MGSPLWQIATKIVVGLLVTACASAARPALVTPTIPASSPTATPPVSAPPKASPQSSPVSATPSATPDHIALPTWTATANMAVARSGNTATLLPDGRVLVTGGGGEDTRYEGGPRSASAELYDRSSGTWIAAPRMIDARVWHSATLLSDGSVLVVGGSVNLREAELFHRGTGKWIATGSTSTPQGGQTATLLLDGRVLVVGGNPGSEFDPLATAELYDPTTGRWTATGSMAVGRVGHTATLLPDGMVLVVGGGSEVRPDEGPYLSATAELYDPVTGRWMATGKMTQARSGHTATLLPDGAVLVAGGGPGDGELYNPNTGRWTVTESMTEARGSGHTATLLRDGTVLVAGGLGPGSDPIALTSAELFDPRSGRWTATGGMAEAHGFSQTATLLSDGRVLVAGGFWRVRLSSAELYDPRKG